MSIHYDANFGIGYKVIAGDSIGKEDRAKSLVEFIELSGGDSERFEWFEAEQKSHRGGVNDVFLVVINPFDSGSDLIQKKSDLGAEIDRLGLKTVGDFGCVGGLEVW